MTATFYVGDAIEVMGNLWIGFWVFIAFFAAWCFVLCLVWLLDDVSDAP